MAERAQTPGPMRIPSEFRTSRRTILRAAGAGALAMAAGGLAAAPGAAIARSQSSAGINIFPRANTWTASPFTEISFRGVTADELGMVQVVGASSGGHSGLVMPHADGNGASFVPDSRFEPGEMVTVRAEVPLGASEDGSHVFGVVQPAEVTPSPESRETNDPEVPPQTFRSRPDLRPPVMEIPTPAGSVDEGYVFLGTRVSDGQAGATILDNDGELVWYNPPLNELDEQHDVRVQEYQGEPVVTFAEANGPTGYRAGHYVICNHAYERIAQFSIANGLTGGDHHEFLLSLEGTALVGAYHPVRWDLTPAGGSRYGRVLDAVIQEIEIDTGRVLFEWHSLDEIGVEESYFDAPDQPDEQFDYFHQNSIGITPDGNLVVSARHTFAIYKIDRTTGDVIWRLNGKQSDFEMGEGSPFAYQHDARMFDNGELSLFDNAATNPDDDATVDSRGLVLALDEEAMTATVAREYIHHTGTLSTSQGNTQLLPNGNVFVGWGSAPVFSEFTVDGELIFDGRFPAGGNSYRAYRFPWVGQPAEPPAIAVEASADSTALYASWNGATEVASWQAMTGSSPDAMEPVGDPVPRAGFETTIPVDGEADYFGVQALDADGAVLGTAEPVEPGA